MDSKKSGLLRAAKFVMFSCGAGVIQAVSFTLMNELLTLPYWPSYLTALTLSVVFNFTVNRRFTFKSAANVPIAMLKVIGYYCVFTPLSTVIGNYFADDKGVNEYIVLAVTMVCNLITEFLFCRFVVYRNSIDTNASAAKAKENSTIQ